jgi:hypothetical protein
MSVIYPKFRPDLLRVMLGYAAMGAVLAGAFGILHDQVTYTISPEYFTSLKFAQFHYADFGLPHRLFVMEIGFLATWWVGFFGGWFLARAAVPFLPLPQARVHCFRGFGIILACAFTGSLVGCGLGLLRAPTADRSAWQSFVTARGIIDLPSFVQVAYIHNASYMGALAGLIIALLYLRRVKQRNIASLAPNN